ncbi:MAG: hypothetical protein E6I87_12310 [Chloroflexi bacterium]|nr:MAG: hypothetical protein E6I87_12310 [Chloroflexota bacterium]
MDTGTGEKNRTLTRRELVRRSALFGGAVVVAPIIAACQPGATPGASTSPGASGSTAAQKVTIRVWGYGLDDARAKARLNVFKAANPNIDVQPVGGTLNTQQLLTAVASGDPPEVINTDRTQVGSWAGRSAIDPITDLIDKDKFDMSQFYPATVEQVKYKGQTYGVPHFATIDLFWINNKVLSDAGTDPASVDPGNWDQLQSLGEKLAKVSGGKVTRTGFDTKMQDGRLYYWTWANGGDLFSSDGSKAQFTDAKAVEALTWARDAVKKQGGEKARAAFSQTQDFFSPNNPFLIGQTAMTIFEQWLLGVLADPGPNFAFTVLPPRKRNSKDPLTTVTGGAFAIPKGVKADKRLAAWEFIKGMVSTDAWIAGQKATFMDKQSKNQKYTPTITGNIKADQEDMNTVYKSIGPSYDAAIKTWQTALNAGKYPYSGPVAQQISDLVTANVNDALQEAKQPADALKKLNDDAQKAIDDYAKGPGNK